VVAVAEVQRQTDSLLLAILKLSSYFLPQHSWGQKYRRWFLTLALLPSQCLFRKRREKIEGSCGMTEILLELCRLHQEWRGGFVSRELRKKGRL
jgi:hypothetical protein